MNYTFNTQRFLKVRATNFNTLIMMPGSAA